MEMIKTKMIRLWKSWESVLRGGMTRPQNLMTIDKWTTTDGIAGLLLSDVQLSLHDLILTIYGATRREVVVLVDEYDHPVDLKDPHMNEVCEFRSLHSKFPVDVSHM